MARLPSVKHFKKYIVAGSRTMRVLLDRLKGFAELLLLAVMLVSWGSSDAVAQFFNSPGGGTGRFYRTAADYG
jgi:hypothetical protein